MWERWKTTYCAAAKKAEIKEKSAGVKDQFRSAYSATPLVAPLPMGSDPKGNNTPMGLAALDRYFDNLAAAATNKKAVL